MDKINETPERLPWHKPEVQQLTVTLDTRIDTRSGSDLHAQDGVEG
jgi:hypothetical protein